MYTTYMYNGDTAFVNEVKFAARYMVDQFVDLLKQSQPENQNCRIIIERIWQERKITETWRFTGRWTFEIVSEPIVKVTLPIANYEVN